MNPQTCFICGFLLFLSIIWNGPENVTNLLLMLSLAVFWIFALGTGFREAIRLVIYGILIAIPVSLLYAATPLIRSTHLSENVIGGYTGGVLTVTLKIVGGFLVMVSTVRSIGLDHLGRIIERFPLPRIFRLILVQIIHQISVLHRETGRIHRAIQTRTHSPHWKSRLRLLQSVPGVWLERLIYKSERVALAMEMRHYVDRPLGIERYEHHTADKLLIIFVCLVFSETLYFRFFA